jgi:hypothetical protein
MRRRDVLLISVASIGWPSVASTQSAGRRRIGVIVLGGTYHAGVAGLRAGLEAAGLDEGSVSPLTSATRTGTSRVSKLRRRSWNAKVLM